MVKANPVTSTDGYLRAHIPQSVLVLSRQTKHLLRMRRHGPRMRFADFVGPTCLCVALVSGFGASTAAAASLCDTRYLARDGAAPTIHIDPDVSRPFRLGLNLEVVPFQERLWNTEHTDTAMMDVLRSMPGTLLRYPGGSVANRVDLNAAIGPGETRRAQGLTRWAGRRPVLFGPHEYVQFVRRVGAAPWLVANLWGDEAGAKTEDVMAARFRSVLGTWPDGDVPGYVELGNELYFPHWGMSAEAYGHRASEAVDLLSTVYPGVRPVIGLAGLDGGRHAVPFNRTVVGALGGRAVDFAFHYYHDGPPGGPPLEAVIGNVCERIGQLGALGRSHARIWITEQARWPGGRVSDPDWARTWSNSFDLRAAVSSAEFTLAVARIPEVGGVFLHALGGVRGPWRTFIENDAGALVPSAPMVAQQLLHALADGEVLATQVHSPGQGRNALIQASGFRTSSGRIGVLVSNRSDVPVSASLSIAGFGGVERSTEVVVLTGTSMSDVAPAEGGGRGFRRAQSRGRQVFDAAGATLIQVPARSVTRILFIH